MLFLKQSQQKFQSRFRIFGFAQFAEQALGSIQNPRFEIVLCQLEDRLLAFVVIQICPIHQVVVHTQGSIHFAATAEQAPQREVQLDGLRVDFDHFDKRLYGFVWLFVE